MRHVAAQPNPNGMGRYPGYLPGLLAITLAYRGHAAEALAAMHGFPPSPYRTSLLVDLALIGAVPADSARSAFAGLSPVELAFLAAPWWAATADTTTLRTLVRRTVAAVQQAAPGPLRDQGAFRAAAAWAWLALARRDTAAALRGFLALPDSVCPGCASERFERALLLAVRQRDAEAVALLDADLMYAASELRMIEVLWMLERARVNERLGRRDAARKAYQYVADVWRHADPELQPYVTEAREGLSRMTSEPRQ